jgi:hypothetical protein
MAAGDSPIRPVQLQVLQGPDVTWQVGSGDWCFWRERYAGKTAGTAMRNTHPDPRSIRGMSERFSVPGPGCIIIRPPTAYGSTDRMSVLAASAAPVSDAGLPVSK